MTFINHLLDASEELFTWNLNDRGFDEAARNWACQMAGIDPEELSDNAFD